MRELGREKGQTAGREGQAPGWGRREPVPRGAGSMLIIPVTQSGKVTRASCTPGVLPGTFLLLPNNPWPSHPYFRLDSLLTFVSRCSLVPCYVSAASLSRSVLVSCEVVRMQTLRPHPGPSDSELALSQGPVTHYT